MFLNVINVEPGRDYVLRLSFSDGTTGDVDLSEELHGEIFEPLRDVGFFAQAAINPETGTVEWPNGADFAPEFLAREGKEVKRVV